MWSIKIAIIGLVNKISLIDNDFLAIFASESFVLTVFECLIYLSFDNLHL